MMKKWVNEKVAGLPTLHDRLDGILAAQVSIPYLALVAEQG
jgi:hypothetical protein